ncbi:hypothetical protein CDAR_56251 [Caerostris darwini]|uniref:Uncharacterized protein n=1 Tax=Caerostris darwini TaxID=1538125 RepID=A0AAV4RSD9_9ARAC|nr:hypothetical protein CDAR_56251 [Caerostris darwini]
MAKHCQLISQPEDFNGTILRRPVFGMICWETKQPMKNWVFYRTVALRTSLGNEKEEELVGLILVNKNLFDLD